MGQKKLEKNLSSSVEAGFIVVDEFPEELFGEYEGSSVDSFISDRFAKFEKVTEPQYGIHYGLPIKYSYGLLPSGKVLEERFVTTDHALSLYQSITENGMKKKEESKATKWFLED